MSQANRRSVAGSGGIGDVIGDTVPTVDGQLVLYNGTTGKHIKAGEEVYLSGTATTSGAVTADLITLSLPASALVYSVAVRVKGFDSTTPAGCVYQIDGGVRTDGATATLIGQSNEFQEEAALSAASVSLVVSGNDLIVRATGVAALDIDWEASLQYF